MYYKKYNEDNKIVKSREPYGPIEEQYMNVELHIIRAHHYMSMLYVLTCNAAERQRPEHFLPLSVGFFLGSRSRIPFRLLSDLDVQPRTCRRARGRGRPAPTAETTPTARSSRSSTTSGESLTNVTSAKTFRRRGRQGTYATCLVK